MLCNKTLTKHYIGMFCYKQLILIELILHSLYIFGWNINEMSLVTGFKVWLVAFLSCTMTLLLP